MTRRGPAISVPVDSFRSDPFPWYRRFRETAPAVWVPEFRAWFVTRFDLCQQVLKDERLVVGYPGSSVYDVLGTHMMSTDGDPARRLRRPHQPTFLPGSIRERIEPLIVAASRQLIDDLGTAEEVELRTSYASRLPVVVMLDLFGLPRDDERRLRSWFDLLEHALGDSVGDPARRAAGRLAAHEFWTHVREHIERIRREPQPGTLLDDLVHRSEHDLSDDEICRNAGIIMFGGISTVEALVLDAMWALHTTPGALRAVLDDGSLVTRAVHETIRWQSPVQTAHRLATVEYELDGVTIPAGDVLSAAQAAANRDPAKFAEPDKFRLDRDNAHHHMGFAAGQHFCLGSHLALAEARVALTDLLDRFGHLRLIVERSPAPSGNEFRQPHALWLSV